MDFFKALYQLWKSYLWACKNPAWEVWNNTKKYLIRVLLCAWIVLEAEFSVVYKEDKNNKKVYFPISCQTYSQIIINLWFILISLIFY